MQAVFFLVVMATVSSPYVQANKREYEKKPDNYCAPSEAMVSTNANDAKIECTANPNCHMFFDSKGAKKKSFAVCENTAKTYASTVGSVLYQELKECSSNHPCLNGGTCRENDTCSCMPGFSRPRCGGCTVDGNAGDGTIQGSCDNGLLCFANGKCLAYTQSAFGSGCAELGMPPLANKNECREAALSLDKTFHSIYLNSAKFPCGCYFYSDGTTRWNIHKTGKKNSEAAEICKKSAGFGTACTSWEECASHNCQNGRCTACSVDGNAGDGTARGSCPEDYLCEANGSCIPSPDCSKTICSGNSAKRVRVCGSDKKTYSNECYFKKAQCENGELRKVNDGPCKDWKDEIATCNDGEGCKDVTKKLCEFDAIKHKCPYKCEACECKDLNTDEDACKSVKRNKMCKNHPFSKVFEKDCAKTCEICGQSADYVKEVPQCQKE